MDINGQPTPACCAPGYNKPSGGGHRTNTLNGDAGADILTGGAGNDRFAFSVFTDTGTSATLRDIINDFVVASDRIDVSAIDAKLTADFTIALLGNYSTTLSATDFVL
jgi:Ca2+-binding RTX toxin-like protein